MKTTAKIKPLVHSAETIQKEQSVSIPVRIVEIGQTGRRGPKGESGLTVEEVDERIRAKTYAFRDLAGNIYD